MKFKKEIILAVILVISLIVGTTIFFYYRTAKVVSSADKLLHIRRAMGFIRQADDYAEDVDTYTHHYTISNDARFADSSAKAIRNFASSIDEINSILVADSIFKDNVANLKKAAGREVHLVYAAISLTSDSNHTAQKIMYTDSASSIFYGVQETLVQVRENVNKVFEDQLIISQETSRSNLHFIFIRSGLVLIIFLTGMYVLNVNMQKRLRAEKKVLDWEKNYTGLIEGAGDVVCKFNNEGVLTFVSSKVTPFSGYKKEEILNKHFSSIIVPEWKERLKHSFSEQLKNKRRESLHELQMLTKKGEKKWIELKTILTADENNKIGFLCICRDINERKKTQLEMEQSGRNQEIFLANMSHEIRTPMNGIIGLAHLMTQTSLNGEQGEYLKGIKDSARKLLAIINDILDISKINAGKITLAEEPFSVQEVINNMLLILGRKAKKKSISLITTLDNSIPLMVLGDHVRLSQILWNLGGNAIKYTKKDGEVRITVNKQFEDNDQVRLSFSIKDNGIGIERSLLPSIFDPFIQANPAASRKYGTGLGLSISKKLVEMQGGVILVESTLGKGSIFSFRLNFKKYYSEELKLGNNVAISDSQRQSVQINTLKGLKALLAEDNLINQKVGVKILEKWGIETDVASNGLLALEKLALHQYDFVLMDLQMPEMNGFDATMHIRTRMAPPKCNIPIIAITAAALNGEYEKCMACGMNDYLLKPFEPKELIKKIDHWVHLSDTFVKSKTPIYE